MVYLLLLYKFTALHYIDQVKLNSEQIVNIACYLKLFVTGNLYLNSRCSLCADIEVFYMFAQSPWELQATWHSLFN